MGSQNSKRLPTRRKRPPERIPLSSSGKSSSHPAGAGFLATEKGYRLLFKCNPQPMYVYDRNTLKFLAVNDAAVQRYGYTRKELLGMTILGIRPSADVPAFMKELARVTARGVDNAGHWRHQKRDGTIIDVEIVTHPLNFDGKRCKLVVAKDVTARKRAEQALRRAHEELEQRVVERTEALRKSEENYRRLLEMSPDAIFVNRDNRVCFINPSGLELFGARRPEQLLGKSVFELSHSDYHPLMRERLR